MKFSHSGDFSKSACNHVQSLLERVPSLRIVISSHWRVYGLEACKKILEHNGIDSSRVVGITGDTKEDGKGDRGYHIEKWLKDHPEVVNFVIIDDESDMGNYLNKLVKTNPFIGLTEKDIESAFKILNKDDKLH